MFLPTTFMLSDYFHACFITEESTVAVQFLFNGRLKFFKKNKHPLKSFFIKHCGIAILI